MSRKKQETKFERVGRILKQLKDEWILLGESWPQYRGTNLLALEIKYSHDRIAWRAYREEYQRIQYLKKKRWIQTKQTEKGLLVRLTDSGRMERWRRDAKVRQLLKDGNVCLVMFDIPEVAKKGRDQFRFFLKRVGFTLVQRSVWQIDLELVDDVVRFVKEARIEKWTAVYIANRKC